MKSLFEELGGTYTLGKDGIESRLGETRKELNQKWRSVTQRLLHFFFLILFLYIPIAPIYNEYVVCTSFFKIDIMLYAKSTPQGAFSFCDPNSIFHTPTYPLLPK